MKVIEQPLNIQTAGIKKQIECKMAVNAHAFRLLARQYSDPIKAILQEIIANAIDANIRANSKTPVYVTLPTIMDSVFSVRDYGDSMSPEKIEEVYSTYMASDKRDTNDEAGFFGIGSKTPFSYVDMFTVTTYIDNVCRNYICHYNEKSLPVISLGGESYTDEPNGTKVSLSVKPQDVRPFINKFDRIRKFFHRPVDCNLQFENPNVLLEADNITVLAGSDGFYIRMGGIGYPILGEFFHNYYTQLSRLHRSKTIIIDVPMGYLSIQPSREGLEYDSTTHAKVGHILDDALKSINAKIKEIIYHNDNSLYCKKILSFYYKFNFEYPSLFLQEDMRISCDLIHTRITPGRRIRGNEWETLKTIEVSDKKTIGFAIIDTNVKKTINRCRNLNHSYVYVFDKSKIDKTRLLAMLQARDEDISFYDESNLPDIKKEETLQRKIKPKTRPFSVFDFKSTTKDGVKTFDYTKNREDIDVENDQVIYVYCIYSYRYKADYKGHEINVGNFANFFESDTKVVIIEPGDAHLLSKKNFTSLKDFFIKSLLSREDVLDKVYNYFIHEKLTNSFPCLKNASNFINFTKSYGNNHQLKDKNLINFCNFCSSIEHCEHFKDYFPEENYIEKYNKILESIKKYMSAFALIDIRHIDESIKLLNGEIYDTVD